MTELGIFVAEITAVYDRSLDTFFAEQIKYAIIGYRATLLKQEHDKYGRFPLGSEDSFCIELKRVSPIECCCSEELEIKVARSKDRIPSEVRANFKPEPFLYVGSSDMSKPFTYAQPHEIENILTGTKFLRNIPLYSFYNDYIYTFNNEGNRLGVREVASNPLELLTLKNCDGLPCINNVYIEDDMKRVIKQMIMEEFRNVREIDKDQEIELNDK